MARVINTNNGNTSSSTKMPFIDRLSHSVIKETSKSLKHYIDVKRRENDFILNGKSTASNAVPLKARFMYGTTKEYPPLYGSYYSDNDLKIYLRSFQKHEKQLNTLSNSPEKQLCRDELKFHMRSNEYSPRESQQFSELRLRTAIRSSSSCSLRSSLDFQKKNSKSAAKAFGIPQDPLIDNAANILASMLQTRRSIYEKYLISQKVSANYDSRNTNPSPRQIDDQSNTQPATPSSYNTSSVTKIPIVARTQKNSKRKTGNTQAKAIYIMRKAKQITKGILCDYQISVKTGHCNGASTNAPICIKLYGTHGHTDFINLVDSATHRVPFLKYQTDLFSIQTYHVGTFAGITIGHNQKDAKASWFLESVSIEDPIRSKNYHILCNAWLSSKLTDQKTIRDFAVNSLVTHQKQNDRNGYEEEIESQSNDSITDDDTVVSDETNSHHYDLSKDDKRTRKHPKQHPKQQHTSTDSTKATNHLSRLQTTAIRKSHSQNRQLSNSQVSPRRIRSPILDRTPPINSDNDDNNINEHNRLKRSTSSSPSTRNRSLIESNFNHNMSQRTDQTTNGTSTYHLTDHNQPSSQLETVNSPIPVPPRSLMNATEQTNGHDHDTFFD